ncbi:hypothetical protein F4703DRAFT_1916570 [Phycomyces blakesleeanus]
MIVSELPSEVLSQIADHLPTEDRLSGSITCKSWRYPFQDALWRNIYIDSEKSLEYIYNTIKPSKNISTSYGLLVHSLRIGGYYEMPDEQQNEFFRYLPNLKHLDLGHMTCKHINTEMTIANQTWIYLESLIINFIGRPGGPTTENLISLLKTCCSLRKLEISAEKRFCPVSFSLKSFDSLHQALPQLIYFKAFISHAHDLQPILDTIPDTIQSLTMAILDISFYQWSAKWLYYFSYKYPNLRSLRLDTSKVIYGWTEIPLKNLKYKATCNRKDLWLHAQLYETNIKRILQSFSGTLENLSIEGTVFFDIKHGPALELSSYAPFLKDLHIKSCGVSINLDDLLDKCPVLKRLRYFGGQLLINSSTMIKETIQQQEKQPQHHGLQILELHRVVTSAEVFSRLSFRCRRLQYMNLSSLWVSGLTFEADGCLLVDMPYTFFKAVRLAHIKYCSPYERRDGDTTISLTLLSQLSDPMSSLPSITSTSDKLIHGEKEKVDRKSVAVVTRKNIAWFHTFLDVIFETDTRIGIRQLSEQEANTAVGFYQSFQSNRDNQPRRVDMPLDGDNLKEDWKDKLCRGYGELRCGQVEKYILPSDSKYDKYFWKYSCNNVFL